jgi:hypothetical protein
MRIQFLKCRNKKNVVHDWVCSYNKNLFGFFCCSCNYRLKILACLQRRRAIIMNEILFCVALFMKYNHNIEKNEQRLE